MLIIHKVKVGKIKQNKTRKIVRAAATGRHVSGMLCSITLVLANWHRCGKSFDPMCYFGTHRLFDNISPFRWDSVLRVFLKEPAQILQRRSKGSANLQDRLQATWTQVPNRYIRYIFYIISLPLQSCLKGRSSGSIIFIIVTNFESEIIGHYWHNLF